MPEVAPPDEKCAEGNKPTYYYGKGLNEIFFLSGVLAPGINISVQYPPQKVQEDDCHEHDDYARDNLFDCEASSMSVERVHTPIMLSIFQNFIEGHRYRVGPLIVASLPLFTRVRGIGILGSLPR